MHLTNYHCRLKDFALGNDDDWQVRNRALTAAGDNCGAVIPCCHLIDFGQGIDYVWSEPAAGRSSVFEGQATQPGRPDAKSGQLSERPSERRVKLSDSSGERGKGDSRAHPRGRWHWDTSLLFIEEKPQVILYGQGRESSLQGKFEGVFIVGGEEKSE